MHWLRSRRGIPDLEYPWRLYLDVCWGHLVCGWLRQLLRDRLLLDILEKSLILYLLQFFAELLGQSNLLLHLYLHQINALFLLKPNLFPGLQLHLQCFNLTSLSFLHCFLSCQLLLVLAALVFIVLYLHLKKDWCMLVRRLLLNGCGGRLGGGRVEQKLRVVDWGLPVETVRRKLMVRDDGLAHWELLGGLGHWRRQHHLGWSLPLGIEHVVISQVVLKVGKWYCWVV